MNNINWKILKIHFCIAIGLLAAGGALLSPPLSSLLMKVSRDGIKYIIIKARKKTIKWMIGFLVRPRCQSVILL